MNNEKMIEASMQMILHAGNARNDIRLAAQKIANHEFEGVDELLKNADNEIVEAHRGHTSVLQSSARGEEAELSVLFTHAQDTLMSTESERFMIETLYNYALNERK